MLHIEWIRQALENAIINGEHRLYEGGCAVDTDKNGRWVPHNYKNGVCPISVICLGDYADGQTHERASEKLGVPRTWLTTFIHAFDGERVGTSDIKQDAWEMGIYFRAKYLYKDGWEWEEEPEDCQYEDNDYSDDEV